MKYNKELHDWVKSNNVLCEHAGLSTVTYTTAVITALLDEIERLQEERRWIPVSESLPEYHERVVFFGGGEMTTHIGYYVPELPQWTAEDGGYYHGKNAALITHWMPLPLPPKGER